ncbi:MULTISPECIES: DUF2237 family protein [Thioalkalivibrio]|uniref:DUF2237 domain-containing protein n=1 Tax=Thioalkalivibrio halophilus TaxID=252474 RepID=A0A1V2ZZF9_9GAMM|nr:MULTISPECIES: DUF2237 domain-containing protein [Thioalkalivibrio]OOC10498.1 hypothetical protein B1A74_05190 [Thioalkalivibrio halophilus]PYG02414.1 hypothetical protein D893_01786 [Thioalkalivibrio sp. ALE21]
MQPFASRNVFGEELEPCGRDPVTGFYRDGRCATGHDDTGIHTVCAEVTQAFLDYSLAQGNDLVTPMEAFGFPGLKPGDRWCLCAGRWVEAYRAGVAPGVYLRATHEETLAIIPLDVLQAHARDPAE